MLLNFKPTTNPDNRFTQLSCWGDCFDEIIIGATCKHVFYLPFNAKGYITKIQLKYQQGLTVVLALDISQQQVIQTDNGTVIEVLLNEEQTKLFKRSFLNTTAQLSFETIDGKKFYSDEYQICVKQPI